MTAVVLIAAIIGFVPRLRRRRKQAPQLRHAEFFDAVAAELRRGASIRHAIAWALPGTRVARLARSGQSMDVVAAAADEQLGFVGRLPIAGIQLASRSGAPSAALFARLAENSRSSARLDGERRALTTQARVSAAVVGLLPVLLGGFVGLARGGFAAGPGAARGVFLLGLGLQLLGAAAIVVLLRRSR